MQQKQVLPRYLDQIPLLKVSGDLDRNNGSKAVEWAEQALQGGAHLLLLDLSDCLYVDSGGLGSLFTILQILNPRGIIGIYGVSVQVYRLMEMVGLVSTPAFRVFSDEAAVRAALEGGEFKFDL